MRSLIRIAAMAILLAHLSACSEEAGPVAPSQGVAGLSLTSPHTDDGALLFTITGAVIGDPEPARAGLLVFSHPAGAGTLRVAVFGHDLSGTLLNVTVPDVSRVSSYTLTIEEVAGPRNQLRSTLTGYRLTL